MTFKIEDQHDQIDIDRLMADERVRKAINESLIELARAERLHPVWPEDVMDQVNIMFGRADRADGAATLLAYGQGSIERLRHRIRQTIAMGIRALINLENDK